MSRNRPPDSNRWARPGSAWKVDTPVLVVSVLTAFFATLFATLLLLRPEASDPTASMIPAGSQSAQSAPRVNTPPVNAPPPDPISKAEPKPEQEPNPRLQIQLEQLGIKCAEGANCYPN